MLACGTSTPPAPTSETTPDATIPEITVLPEPGEVPGDYLWVGSSDRIDDLLISFCVYQNHVDLVHIATEISCQDKQTGENYSYWVDFTTEEGVWFALDQDGFFNSAGYEMPEGVYGGLIVGLDGYLSGNTGNVQVILHSENDVARCEAAPPSINVRRTQNLCVRY